MNQALIGTSLQNSFESGAGFGYALLEIFILLAIGFYIIFSFVVIKQVSKMSDTLDVGLGSPLKFIALVHLLASIGLFFIALAIL